MKTSKLKPTSEPPILFSAPKIKLHYFNWLCSIVGASTPKQHYKRLCRRLHRTEFRWTIPNDDNRESDGKKLRGMYAVEANPFDSFNEHYVFSDNPASCLEVLVGLAIRIEDMLTDEKHDDRTSEWFWMMAKNLGLNKFTDEDYFDLFGDREVDKILDIWLDRRFDRDGRYGLFPLRRTRYDQKSVEIWYQMMEYLTERSII